MVAEFSQSHFMNVRAFFYKAQNVLGYKNVVETITVPFPPKPRIFSLIRMKKSKCIYKSLFDENIVEILPIFIDRVTRDVVGF